jgi:hypothetical protein
MDNVRLTVQIRDQHNKVRTTMHRDVPLNRVAEKAEELARRQSQMFRKEAKEIEIANKE